MQDLMLHILDVAMNAVVAGARTVKISVVEEPEKDLFRLVVADDGPGMTADLVERVLNEFATTKPKKEGWVGFGLALLRGTTELCEGRFRLLSRPGVGTLVVADLPYHHPDRPPLGDVVRSLQPLLSGCPDVDLCFTHRVGAVSYRLDTRTVRRAVGEAYATRVVRRWLLEQIGEGELAFAERSEVS